MIHCVRARAVTKREKKSIYLLFFSSNFVREPVKLYIYIRIYWYNKYRERVYVQQQLTDDREMWGVRDTAAGLERNRAQIRVLNLI